jgi:UDP-glucuronate 4-epimerase
MGARVAVVTGAAGFIGSHVTDGLLELGWSVRGIDAFTEYYDPALKRDNIRSAALHPRFTLLHRDVCDTAGVRQQLEGADVLIHLAAEAGVRSSWGDGFARYVQRNIVATQELLELAREFPRLERIVVASSSSVYGDAMTFPTPEDGPTRPYSPYGITKLAAEHLATTYAANWDLPTVSLRFFTVYGPRQRPDMAFHRLIEAALGGPPFPLYGSGEQQRDFTYVGDVTAAILAVVIGLIDEGELGDRVRRYIPGMPAPPRL